MKYYFISKSNFDGQTLAPRVPIHKYECEDATTERICVSQSINGCLSALPGRFDIDDVIYIHECESSNVMQPSLEQVPDSCFTGEQWILEPVEMKLFMTVVIIGKLCTQINDMSNVVCGFRLCE